MAETKITQNEALFTVQSYTNTGSGGGTGYYVNLGGIKICWGLSGSFTAGSNSNLIFSLPSGFFTTVQFAESWAYNAANTTLPGGWTTNGMSTTVLSVFSGGTSGSSQAQWFVIGT